MAAEHVKTLSLKENVSGTVNAPNTEDHGIVSGEYGCDDTRSWR